MPEFTGSYDKDYAAESVDPQTGDASDIFRKFLPFIQRKTLEGNITISVLQGAQDYAYAPYEATSRSANVDQITWYGRMVQSSNTLYGHILRRLSGK